MNRIAVYVVWDGESTTASFSTFFLERLREVVSRVIVVVCGRLSVEGRRALESRGAEIIVHEDKRLVLCQERSIGLCRRRELCGLRRTYLL